VGDTEEVSVRRVHEFVKISLRVHRNKKGWRALRYTTGNIWASENDDYKLELRFVELTSGAQSVTTPTARELGDIVALPLVTILSVEWSKLEILCFKISYWC